MKKLKRINKWKYEIGGGKEILLDDEMRDEHGKLWEAFLHDPHAPMEKLTQIESAHTKDDLMRSLKKLMTKGKI